MGWIELVTWLVGLLATRWIEFVACIILMSHFNSIILIQKVFFCIKYFELDYFDTQGILLYQPEGRPVRKDRIFWRVETGFKKT